VQGFQRLGYPEHLLNLLGTAKIIGVISILQNRFTLLKEWAYAGFTINLIGASWSHLSVGEPIIMPLILFIVLMSSYILWKKIIKSASDTPGSRVSEFALPG
jgi:hypothetical protein